ncbi:MAG: hypothetical protein ACUVXA_19100, partial [Candidatus Jordarchaeum sp.]|uniref:hypothetical protein n=1 Tax=Candidatus Jordarchaeum sp. TaxID=2823881 RepID=UPI00404B8A71
MIKVQEWYYLSLNLSTVGNPCKRFLFDIRQTNFTSLFFIKFFGLERFIKSLIMFSSSNFPKRA